MGKYDEKKAIEKGKEWMRKSKNITHDYVHAKNVGEYGLKIFKSLKDVGWSLESEIDENLILIAAWWHDCYKSTFDKIFLLGEFMEGIRASKIAEKELSGLMEKKRLNLVVKAIRNHNNVPYLLLMGKRLPILTRILIEGDTLDAKTHYRKKKREGQSMTWVYRIAQYVLEPSLNFLQKIYVKSPYGRERLKRIKWLSF
jgi:hypothetical protein